MSLFTKAQIKEMNNTMHLATFFIDVKDKEQVLNVIFNGVAFSGANITDEQKKEALTFARNY
jgi:hypothetical protein